MPEICTNLKNHMQGEVNKLRERQIPAYSQVDHIEQWLTGDNPVCSQCVNKCEMIKEAVA